MAKGGVIESASMSGPEKAAIMLIALGDEVAGNILEQLDDTEITKISSYMSTMGGVSSSVVDEVLEEFLDMAQSGKGGYVSGGRDYLRKMLEWSMPPEKASMILDKLSSPEEEEVGGGLEAVRHLDPPTIASFLSHEHPQTCAIILSHLDAQHAAAVVKELPEKLQPDVMLRVATLDRVPPGVIKELDQALANEFRASGATEGAKIGGVESAAEIINSLDRATEVNVLGEIETENAELAEDIRQLMFVFEDLLKLDDRGMQAILKEINSDELILALKTASDPLQEKVFANMSERAALMMKEDMEAMGPVRLADVEAAQQGILRVVKRLEEEGKIMLAGAGEELV